MLIGFKLKNFRSFLKEQSFSFSRSAGTHAVATSVSTGIKAVPQLSTAAMIFGANGSGKTNFIKAMETLRDLVLESTSYTAQQFSERHTPFQFDSSVGAATDFEIDVVLEKIRYRYRVSYCAERVLEEKLLVHHTGKAQRWFERHFDASTGAECWAPFSPNFHGPREMWRKATRPSALFLTTAAQLNSAQLAPLYFWFEHCLEVLHSAHSNGVTRVAARMQDLAFKSRVLRFLKSVDIKVDDVRVREQESSSTTNALVRTSGSNQTLRHPAHLVVEFLHSREGSKSVWVRSDFESVGTHRLFGLFGPLVACLEQKKLLLIDDFDMNLHPLVAQFLIQFIASPDNSRHGAQMLLVSHNTALMDLSQLRRDEIWLTELDAARVSTLSTVSRSGSRKHEQLSKNYLRGRYGAVPSIQP